MIDLTEETSECWVFVSEYIYGGIIENNYLITEEGEKLIYL
jgi:hypothetical protein